MEKLIEIYYEIFPQTSLADWYFAFLGLLAHAMIKLKNVRFREFREKKFFGEFLPVWFFSLFSIVILIGTLPLVMSNYNVLDSALIGYASSSIFKQLLKHRRFGNMNILE